jgi:hypothetical protein
MIPTRQAALARSCIEPHTLPDYRTPPEWIDDLSTRFSALGVDPEAPPAAIRHR